MEKLGNQQTMREINKSLLLHLVYQDGPISRVDLSRRTKLSPTTVSVLIDEAIRDGVIYESGTSGTGVGRKMTMLSIKEDSGYVLGIDLSNSPSHCVLLNMRGKIVATQPLKRMIGEETIRGELVELIRDFAKKQNIELTSIKWMGVSVPGRITADQKFVSSTYLEVENMPLKDILYEAFRIPVHLVNDLDAAGFAERFSGAALGHQTIVYILIDYGIGAGLVLNNQIYRGSTGRAGRVREFFGYSTGDLASRLTRLYPDTFRSAVPEETIRQFIRLGLQGTEPFASEMRSIMKRIAKYCGDMLMLLNPEQLILSGWITTDEQFFRELVDLIHEHEDNWTNTPIAISYWKEFGAAIGAATLGLHQMFKVKTVE
ncbi:ROK family protein [Gordoniibacillus kamchatkensis]|uniref:ROK family protein n=1 Tax=Gordoniibacillus kamchatkensis TaxID=1590651 RepID=A0ABR5AJ60_9BACL|nr:ROK family transcriptional regulator [Paenibacillus sp. VKM B-2647]KIL40868.1 ROK family protein [Paenibacillus sp. VKM B-2647]